MEDVSLHLLVLDSQHVPADLVRELGVSLSLSSWDGVVWPGFCSVLEKVIDLYLFLICVGRDSDSGMGLVNIQVLLPIVYFF